MVIPSIPVPANSRRGRRPGSDARATSSRSGTLEGHYKRKYTGTSDWEQAKAVAAQWDAAGHDDEFARRQRQLHPPQEPTQPDRITIEDAIKVFLTNREGAQIASPTLRKYRTFARQITGFADSKGYVMLDQIKTSDIDLYYSTLKLGPRTKSKRLSTIRAFFRFCVNREWILKSPVSPDIKPPVGSQPHGEQSPVQRSRTGPHHRSL